MKKSVFKRAMICCLAFLTITAALTACDGGKDSVSSDADSDNKSDFSSIAGTWLEKKREGITAISVDEDGTFYMIYSSGAIDEGIIKIENEEHPDGTSTEWFNFYDQNGELWAGIPNDETYAENPPTELWSGQDGSMHFERVKGTKSPKAEDYPGTWISGRCSVEISEKDGKYLVNITWGSSVSEYAEWNYICKYDKDSCSLVCDGKATLVNHVFNEKGKDKKTTVYKDGTGSFKIKDGILRWVDDKENAGVDMFFLAA